MLKLNSISMELLNRWQRDFPLVEQPFEDIARALGLCHESILLEYRQLAQASAFSRIGGIFAPGSGGASTLAALAVAPHQLARVAAIVSAQPGVNHNYEREHQVNLWFVVTGAHPAHIEQQIKAIEHASGLDVIRLPMKKPFRIDTAFCLHQPEAPQTLPQQTHPMESHPPLLDDADLALAALVEHGIPLHPEPYARWAELLKCSSRNVTDKIAHWLDCGILRRFGVVVRHHEAGFRANAMTVFDIPDAHIDAAGMALARCPGVTLVYQRERTARWPFSLYCMIHGRDRKTVLQCLQRAVESAGLQRFPRQTLFSLTRFKQTGARRFAAHLPTAQHQRHSSHAAGHTPHTSRPSHPTEPSESSHVEL